METVKEYHSLHVAEIIYKSSASILRTMVMEAWYAHYNLAYFWSLENPTPLQSSWKHHQKLAIDTRIAEPYVR